MMAMTNGRVVVATLDRRGEGPEAIEGRELDRESNNVASPVNA